MKIYLQIIFASATLTVTCTEKEDQGCVYIQFASLHMILVAAAYVVTVL